MQPINKPDEFYQDGKDKWIIQYSVNDDTKINPGDYKEIREIRKNGQLVGSTVWHKNKDGRDKTSAYETGIQLVPQTAKKVKK